MLRKLLREPLVHFLGFALLIFIAYGTLNRKEVAKPDRIVITQARIEQIAGVFARTWQRPPTAPELKGLLDDFVKEEVYAREAIALGLDRDDAVIRRRLRQKIEFLTGAEQESITPTDAELEDYLKANSAKFAIGPSIAFRQIFLNPERRGEKIDQDATAILESLRSDPALDPASLGDTTLLPAALELTSITSIGQTFGREFADAIAKAKPGEWMGPVRSGFGLHILRVTDMQQGRIPALSDVRTAVVREWANEKRKAQSDARFAELLKRYEITIEGAPGDIDQAASRP